jgi:hypothetical protein
MSRTAIFLSVLSAAIVALALLANATGFEPRIAPALEPYFSISHHDDERGLAASYLLARFHGGGLGRGRALFSLERHTLDPLRRGTPRFPTPPDES